jgi:predicted RNase H-like HicB family nuclease
LRGLLSAAEAALSKPLFDNSSVGSSEAIHMLKIETEREDDGRWIAEVPTLLGVLTYGASERDARVKATTLAFRVILDRLKHGELRLCG